MSDKLDPGPPLIAEKEIYPCQRPGMLEYGKAVGAALLITLGGGTAWVAITVMTGRTWGILMVLIGLVAGWIVNRAAGQLRSVSLGVIAAVSAVLAYALGYVMLWLPFLAAGGIERPFTWEQMALLILMILVSYRMAAPKANARSLL